jgi:hypothetical protein
MELGVLEGIPNEVIPGGGFTKAGQPKLNRDVWIIPFRHHQFGLGQVFLPDRDVGSTSDQRPLKKEIRELLVWALASSQ